MNTYIDPNAKHDMVEIIEQLKKCTGAMIDNDCVYFETDTDETIEVPEDICMALLLHMLGIPCESV